MRVLKQNTARNIMVFMTQSSDHVSGLTGATLTITASKDGAAFASITPSVTERGNGWYEMALTSSHTDTIGDLALHVTAASADPSDILTQVTAGLPGASGIAKGVALPGFTFLMFDTDGNPALNLIGISAKVSIDGAAFVDCTNDPSEIGNGWYKIDLDAADTTGKTLGFKFTVSGCKPTEFTTVTDA